MVHTCVTSPTIKDTSLKKAIVFFLSNRDQYDSVYVAHYVKKFLFLGGKPINYDPNTHPKSQNLPDIIARTPTFSIMERETMLLRRDNIGEKPSFYILDEYEAIDIDEQIDFDFAEFIYKKMNNNKLK